MSPSQFIRTVRLALKSLMLHRLRSGLTMLGIVFGVFSVIAMLAIGEGASEQAQKQVLALGATNVIVVSVKPPSGVAQSTSNVAAQTVRYGLKNEDFELLSTIPTVVEAIPIREVKREARYADKKFNARIVACTEGYREVNHIKLAAGRFLTEQDQDHLANVVVLAHQTALEMFGFKNPVGKSITFGTMNSRQAYVVVGVMQDRMASAAIGGSLSGQDFNKDIYLPIKTFVARITNLDIEAKPGNFNSEYVELNQITLRVARQEDVLPTAEVVRESLARLHKDKKDVNVVVPLELLKQAEQLRTIFNVVLGSIAAISLIVGGIGIMNIMLATVTERTREIGIRRSMGAKQRDITHQFLMETIVLSGTGGLIGVVLGLLTPFIFAGIRTLLMTKSMADGSGGSSELGRIFSGMEPSVPFWSLPLSFGFSVFIGVVFGLYPARAAARLDPIEALRHE